MSFLFFYDDYVAIIGDIIDSKKIEDRNASQQKLKETLSKINCKYEKNIASKFIITLGDEFQGLLKNREHVIDIISDIDINMLPINLRYGIGVGSINTDINFNNSSEIDGSSYHRARKMLSELDHKKNRNKSPHSNIKICSEDENIVIDELMNSIFSVCTALKSKWTERQKNIIQAYVNNNENQYHTASFLGISQPSVTKALQNANFYTYKSAFNKISSFLRNERTTK